MPEIKDEYKSPINRIEEIDTKDIEDIMIAPLKKDTIKDINELKELKNSKPESAKSKLERIFKNTDISDYYETDGNGNLIVGYEEIEEHGKKIKRPILQNKLDVFDENNLLNIEVEINPKFATQKDDLGLTPLERKRYDKLMTLNKGQNFRTHDEIIRKAKNTNDLDSSIVPDMMIHFLTNEEDEMDELSLREKNEIKRMRQKGMVLEPKTLSGIHKSLKLISKDKTVYYSNFFRWLTRKGHNMENLTTEQLAILQAEYKKEIRPSIELLIDSTITGTQDRVLDYIAKEYEDDEDNENGIMQVRVLRNNPQNYVALIEIMKENQFEVLQPDAMKEVETYFRVYGLHEEDSKQFAPNYVSDPRSNITTSQKLEEFKTMCGCDFLDVYEYWWNIVSDDKAKMDELKLKSDDGISKEEVENSEEHIVASKDTTIIEDIDFEDDELDLI